MVVDFVLIMIWRDLEWCTGCLALNVFVFAMYWTVCYKLFQCLLLFLQVFSFYVLHINLSTCHNYPYKGGVISPQAKTRDMVHMETDRIV